MDDNRFFKFLWRFNAIAISLAVLLLVIGVGSDLVRRFMHRSIDRPDTAIVDISNNQPKDETWELGHTQRLNTETPIILIPLYTDKEAMKADKSVFQISSSYAYRPRSDSTINYLFIDIESTEKRWLFSNNKQLVVSNIEVGGPNRDDYHFNQIATDKTKTKAIIFETINTDTSNDGLLNLEDKTTISITTPTGKRYTELVKGIDRIVGAPVLSKKHVIIIYQKNGRGYTMQVSLEDFSVLDNSQLPKI